MPASRTRSKLWRTIWRAGVLGRCPECGRTSMFSSFYDLHEQCEVCGTRFESNSGEWLGGTAIGYMLGACVALALSLIEVQWAPIRGLGLPAMWTIAAVTIATTVIGYRPSKALWFGIVYEMGFMAGGDRPEASGRPRR